MNEYRKLEATNYARSFKVDPYTEGDGLKQLEEETEIGQ